MGNKSIDRIFWDAAQIASPVERKAYLERACGGDVELRRRVEQLLEARPKADDFFRPPDVTQASGSGEPVFEPEGAIIGPYRLMEQIGEGGMGLVFVAEQQQPVRRKVALKLIKPGMDTRQVIARFEAERQALAMMDHPNIAKVLDAGTTETGRPYFVMELVKGVPITEYCDQDQLTPRERLELFVTVCQAVQHAHQKGIIHRDIKPSNVLVTLLDDKPVVKVIDFGVAKAIGQQLTERTIYTAFAQMVGTPLYMSPEQAALSGVDVDTRSDLYSLGVLLYELLTGTTPFDKSRLQQAAFDEVRRIICEEEPQKPSTRISSLGATLSSVSMQRRMEPHKLSQLVRGDLDWIVMKALEKDRGRRYDTAASFAADVLRYLNDEPVAACPPSRVYRLRKFARRNKALIGTVALVLAALVAGTAVSVWQAVRATIAEGETATQRDAATDAERRATDNANRAKAQQGIAERNEATAKANERIAKANELLALQRYYAAQMNLAARAWEEGDTPRVLELLESQRPRITDEDLRAFEWYALWQLCHSQLRYSRQEVAGLTYKLAFSPDSSLIALGSTDGTVKLIDAVSGQDVRTLAGTGRSRSGAVAFSPDGKWLAQGNNTGEVTLWDVATGEPGLVLSGTGFVEVLAFSPNGELLATSTYDGTARLWETKTGSLLATWQAGGVSTLAFSPDGNLLATSSIGSSDKKGVCLWDLSVSPPVLARELSSRGRSVAFSSDGKHFAMGAPGMSGSVPHVFDVFDTQTWKSLPLRKGHWGDGWAVAFVPGRDAVAVGVDSRSVKIIDLKTSEATTLPHHSSLRSLAVAPDGTAVAAIGADAVLKVWNLGSPARPDLIDSKSYISSLALDPQSRTLAVGSGRMVKLFDVDSGANQGTLPGHSFSVKSMAFFPQGQLLASGSTSWNQPGELLVWDLGARVLRQPAFDFRRAAHAVAVSPDQRTLAVGGPQGELALFDVATAQQREQLKVPSLTALTYSPDGNFLISAGQAITLRDPLTGAERNTFAPKEIRDWIWSLACSADSRLLATGNQVGLVHLWELPSGRLRATLRGNTSSVRSVAFFHDGKTLATANDGGEVKLWDVATGQERITFRFGSRLAVSADGQFLAAGGPNGTVRLLRASTSPEALARKSELNPDDPESPLTQNDGADRLWAARQHQEAEDTYRQAQQRLNVLLAQAPEVVEFRRELCRSGLSLKLLLEQQKKYEEAEQIWQSVQPALRALPPEEQPALAQYVTAVAALLRQADRAEQANRLCLDAADTFARLPPNAAADPARRTIVNSLYSNVLGLLGGDDQSSEAERVYGQWIAALELLTAGRSDEPVAVADLKRLNQHCRQLVQQHAAAKDARAALADYQPVADFYRRLIAEHPHDVDLFNDSDSLRQAVAMLLINNEAAEQGEKLLAESLAESIALASERPEHAESHAGRLYNLGVARLKAMQPDAALELFQQAFDLHVQLVEQAPADAARREKFRSFLLAAGKALVRGEHPQECVPLTLHGIEVYERLVDDHTDNVELRADSLRNISEAAWLLINTAKLPEPAETVVLRGLAAADQACVDFPDEAAIHWQQAGLRFALGWAKIHGGHYPEAADAFRDEIKRCEALDAKWGSEPAQRLSYERAFNGLGIALQYAGKIDDAIAAQTRALELAEKLAADVPDNEQYVGRPAVAHSNLASLHRQAGNSDEARRHYLAVFAFYRDHPQQEDAREKMNSAASALLKLATPSEEYEQFFRAHVASLEAAAAAAPDDAESAYQLVVGRRQLAIALVNLRRSEEAEHAYRQSISECERLAATFPGEHRYQSAEAISRYDLGLELTRTRRFAEAEAEQRRALALREELAKDDPAGSRDGLGMSHYGLGDALAGGGRLEEAEQAFRQATVIYSELTAETADRPVEWFENMLATSQRRLGEVLAETAQYAGAAEAYTASIEHYQTLVNRFAGDNRYRRDMALAANNLAWLLATCEQAKLLAPGRAVELARKAVELAPTEGNNWNTLGVAQYRTGDWAAAVESLSKSDQLGGEAVLGFNAFFLAMAHLQLGDQDEARAWYTRAVEWTDLYLPYNEELCRFGAEASELLGLESGPDSAPPRDPANGTNSAAP